MNNFFFVHWKLSIVSFRSISYEDFSRMRAYSFCMLCQKIHKLKLIRRRNLEEPANQKGIMFDLWISHHINLKLSILILNPPFFCLLVGFDVEKESVMLKCFIYKSPCFYKLFWQINCLLERQFFVKTIFILNYVHHSLTAW